ncbi:MAG: hypothetical protein ACRC2T_12205 [Thermoguttaceae bacterium]
MTQKIKYGNRIIEREQFSRAQELFNNEEFISSLNYHLEMAEQHASKWPTMDKPRTVNVKLSITPKAYIDEKEGKLVYKNSLFSASVSSLSLPSVTKEIICGVINGKSYYNFEDTTNPNQLTFRDGFEDGEDDPVYDGKAEAVK